MNILDKVLALDSGHRAKEFLFVSEAMKTSELKWEKQRGTGLYSATVDSDDAMAIVSEFDLIEDKRSSMSKYNRDVGDTLRYVQVIFKERTAKGEMYSVETYAGMWRDRIDAIVAKASTGGKKPGFWYSLGTEFTGRKVLELSDSGSTLSGTITSPRFARALIDRFKLKADATSSSAVTTVYVLDNSGSFVLWMPKGQSSLKDLPSRVFVERSDMIAEVKALAKTFVDSPSKIVSDPNIHEGRSLMWVEGSEGRFITYMQAQIFVSDMQALTSNLELEQQDTKYDEWTSKNRVIVVSSYHPSTAYVRIHTMGLTPAGVKALEKKVEDALEVPKIKTGTFHEIRVPLPVSDTLKEQYPDWVFNSRPSGKNLHFAQRLVSAEAAGKLEKLISDFADFGSVAQTGNLWSVRIDPAPFSGVNSFKRFIATVETIAKSYPGKPAPPPIHTGSAVHEDFSNNKQIAAYITKNPRWKVTKAGAMVRELSDEEYKLVDKALNIKVNGSSIFNIYLNLKRDQIWFDPSHVRAERMLTAMQTIEQSITPPTRTSDTVMEAKDKSWRKVILENPSIFKRATASGLQIKFYLTHSEAEAVIQDIKAQKGFVSKALHYTVYYLESSVSGNPPLISITLQDDNSGDADVLVKVHFQGVDVNELKDLINTVLSAARRGMPKIKMAPMPEAMTLPSGWGTSKKLAVRHITRGEAQRLIKAMELKPITNSDYNMPGQPPTLWGDTDGIIIVDTHWCKNDTDHTARVEITTKGRSKVKLQQLVAKVDEAIILPVTHSTKDVVEAYATADDLSKAMKKFSKHNWSMNGKWALGTSIDKVEALALIKELDLEKKASSGGEFLYNNLTFSRNFALWMKEEGELTSCTISIAINNELYDKAYALVANLEKIMHEATKVKSPVTVHDSFDEKLSANAVSKFILTDENKEWNTNKTECRRELTVSKAKLLIKSLGAVQVSGEKYYEIPQGLNGVRIQILGDWAYIEITFDLWKGNIAAFTAFIRNVNTLLTPQVEYGKDTQEAASSPIVWDKFEKYYTGRLPADYKYIWEAINRKFGLAEDPHASAAAVSKNAPYVPYYTKDNSPVMTSDVCALYNYYGIYATGQAARKEVEAYAKKIESIKPVKSAPMPTNERQNRMNVLLESALEGTAKEQNQKFKSTGSDLYWVKQGASAYRIYMPLKSTESIKKACKLKLTKDGDEWRNKDRTVIMDAEKQEDDTMAVTCFTEAGMKQVFMALGVLKIKSSPLPIESAKH